MSRCSPRSRGTSASIPTRRPSTSMLTAAASRRAGSSTGSTRKSRLSRSPPRRQPNKQPASSMLFLSEQDVKDALSGGDAYQEAVAVIEDVLRQQAAGTTHHLKRTTMVHPDHPGHLWHNIRILPGMAPEL